MTVERDAGPASVIQLLVAWGNGDERALDQMLPLVYAELRRLAAHYLRRERDDHSLQPTALVHEAYRRDPRKARVVELKFFGGLTIEEIAGVLQVSGATVEREWRSGASRAPGSTMPWKDRRVPGEQRALAATH